MKMNLKLNFRRLLENFNVSSICLIVLMALLFIITSLSTLSGYEAIAEISFRGWVALLISEGLWTGLLLSPLLLCNRHAPFFYVPFFFLSVLTCVIEWYARVNYRMTLGGEWVGIVLASSWQEVLTFVQCSVSATTVICIIALGVGMWWSVLFFRRCYFRKGNFLRALLALAFIGLFVAWFPGAVNRPVSFLCHASPSFNMWYETYGQLTSYVSRRDVAPPSGLCLACTRENYPLAIIILGESATRNRWSLYGYERKTTPFVDSIKDEVIKFTDYVGTSSTTADAIKYLFTEATLEDPFRFGCSYSQILKAAGYQCFLFSSQQRWGKFNAAEELLSEGCVAAKYSAEDGGGYDDKLLGYLDLGLGQITNCPTVVFMHLIGSHFPPNIYYPNDRGIFAPEEIPNRLDGCSPRKTRNHYDNTIVFTDSVLKGVVERLKRISRPSLMLYLSDHGESVESMRYRDVSDKNMYELPLICWFSEEFKREFPATVAEMESAKDRPLRTDCLLTGLVSLLQIRGYGNAEDDFHSDRFVPKKQLIGNGKVEYKQLERDKRLLK